MENPSKKKRASDEMEASVIERDAVVCIHCEHREDSIEVSVKYRLYSSLVPEHFKLMDKAGCLVWDELKADAEVRTFFGFGEECEKGDEDCWVGVATSDSDCIMPQMPDGVCVKRIVILREPCSLYDF